VRRVLDTRARRSYSWGMEVQLTPDQKHLSAMLSSTTHDQVAHLAADVKERGLAWLAAEHAGQ